jgi:hypothetical protein
MRRVRPHLLPYFSLGQSGLSGQGENDDLPRRQAALDCWRRCGALQAKPKGHFVMKPPARTDMQAARGKPVPPAERIRFLREIPARLSSLLTDVSILQRWLWDLLRCA